jgi:phosphate uptake regulator
MSKLSQRSVDYAIKGYRLGSPEFCRYVRRGDRQLRVLRRKITDLCQKLLAQKPADDSEILTNERTAASEMRFPSSALRICNALHATCTAAAEIAHHTMLLLEDARLPCSAALEKVCYLVNRLICLCIVALFKKECQHAVAVLQNQDFGRLFEQAFHDLQNDVDRRITIPAALELAITNSLRQIATQAQEIAEAIVFWLEGKRCVLESSVSAHR